MHQTNDFLPYMVADIGGTNARFGLVTSVNLKKQEFIIENQQTFASCDFESIEQAVTCYQQTLSDKSVNSACLAVAGPVSGEQIKLTNLNWNFNITNTQRDLGFKELYVINDFAAYAYAIQYLEQQNLRTINQGVAVKNAPIAVVGPGTGFGVAALLWQNNRAQVLASEGGHMSLAANTALQAAIKEQLSRKFSLVSIERVFSGPGLRHLYRALAAVEGTTALKLSTSEISQHALAGTDPMCQRTLALFCSWLGSVTGDLALTLGAKGGVFLSGGILPKIADFLVESDFQRAFKSKDQMSHYLQDIPVQLVTKGNSALLGAAAWLVNAQGQKS